MIASVLVCVCACGLMLCGCKCTCMYMCLCVCDAEQDTNATHPPTRQHGENGARGGMCGAHGAARRVRQVAHMCCGAVDGHQRACARAALAGRAHHGAPRRRCVSSSAGDTCIWSGKPQQSTNILCLLSGTLRRWCVSSGDTCICFGRLREKELLKKQPSTNIFYNACYLELLGGGVCCRSLVIHVYALTGQWLATKSLIRNHHPHIL